MKPTKPEPKKPSKAFVKEMETMYPKGATITPAKKQVIKGKKK